MNEKIKQDFLAILGEELVPAMGCTEPIALAYAAAKGRAALGCDPERITAYCSGNIIKNVRCVRIPNSGGMTGIEAACALGALAGNAQRNMEVLESVSDEGRRAARNILVGFDKTDTTAGQEYGHALVVNAIIDGKVVMKGRK